MDFVRQAQQDVKRRVLEAFKDIGLEPLLEPLQAWFLQLDLLAVTCMLEELGGPAELWKLLAQRPVLLLAKLVACQAQELLPPSATQGLYDLFVAEVISLLEPVMPEPSLLAEPITVALQTLRRAPGFPSLLAEAAVDIWGSPQQQLAQLFFKLAGNLLDEALPSEVLLKVYSQLCEPLCALAGELGASDSLLQRCRNLEEEALRSAVQKSLVLCATELEKARPLRRSLEACALQLAHQMLLSALRRGAPELQISPASSAQLEQCLEDLPLRHLRVAFQDPERFLRLAAGAGSVALQLLLAQHRAVLEQRLGQALSDQQLAVLCRGCEEVFAAGGVARLKACLSSPWQLLPHVLRLALPQLMHLEPLWRWAQGEAGSRLQHLGAPPSLVELLHSSPLSQLLEALQKLSQAEVHIVDLERGALLLAKSTLLCAIQSASTQINHLHAQLHSVPDALEPLLLDLTVDDLKCIATSLHRLRENPKHFMQDLLAQRADTVMKLVPELVFA